MIKKEIRSMRQLALLVAETATKRKFKHELFVVKEGIKFGKFKGRTLEGIQGIVADNPDIFLVRISEKKLKEIKKLLLEEKEFTTNSLKRPKIKLYWRIV